MGANYDLLLETAHSAALAAGQAILGVYAHAFDVRHKIDSSPVTQADELAEAIIVDRLRAAAPDIPVIAEENVAATGLPHEAPARFWLVDPLDGTKEFVARNGEFTVNIALVEGDRSVLGVVHVPVSQTTFLAAGIGTATCRRPGEAPRALTARPVPARGAIVVHSRSHVDERELAVFVATLPDATRRVSGSSIKFCLLASGEADVYPRFGRTMEWDTAAGQAVLEAAGGSVRTLDGTPLRYGKPGFVNPDFVARGRT